MKIELLEHPLSPFAQKVKIALTEKGVPFSLVTPEGIGSGRTTAEYRAAHPRGEVPVLFADGRPIFDSTIIMEFLEDAFPETSLMPKDPFERARMRTIEEVCDTYYEAINWGMSEITYFRRAEGDLAKTIRASAEQQVATLNAWLDKQLGDAEWFGGDRFNWGDIVVIPVVQGAAGFGLKPAEGGRLQAWHRRVRTHPSVAAVLKAAKDSIGDLGKASNNVEAAQMKRQYRDYRLEWMIKSGGFEVVRKGLEADNIRFNAEPV